VPQAESSFGLWSRTPGLGRSRDYPVTTEYRIHLPEKQSVQHPLLAQYV